MRKRIIHSFLAFVLSLSLLASTAAYAAETDVQTDVNVQEAEETQEIQQTQIETATENEALKGIGTGIWVLTGGRWWYQYTDGSYPASELKQIDGKTYYFDAAGWMVTGWYKLKDGWRYFDGSGAMQMSRWIGNYYVQKNGIMAVSQWIGEYYVGSDGAWIPGKVKVTEGWVQSGGRWWYQYADGSYPASELKQIGGKTYYFDTAGWMVTGWYKLKDGWRYFDGSGAMQTSRWIGDYYVQKNGIMAVSQWIGDKYVGTDGKWIPDYVEANKNGNVYSKPELAGDLTLTGKWVTSSNGTWYQFEDGSYPAGGWLKIEDDYYYFDESGWILKNQWIGDYKVDANGKWRYVKVKDSNGKIYNCERQYLTDPQVSDMVFWTAIVYAESGDQGIAGMSAVAMCILNRMNSRSYPNDLRTVVYQSSQYQPARTGALTKYLKNDNAAIAAKYRNNTRTAVQNALAVYDAYLEGTGTRQIEGITLPEGEEFDYCYFMTPAAFRQCNLDEEACDVLYVLKEGNDNPEKGHIFFRKWVPLS